MSSVTINSYLEEVIATITEYSLGKDLVILKITQNTTTTELKQIASELNGEVAIMLQFIIESGIYS